MVNRLAGDQYICAASKEVGPTLRFMYQETTVILDPRVP